MLSAIGWWIPVVQGAVFWGVVALAFLHVLQWSMRWTYPAPPAIVPSPPPAPNVTPASIPIPITTSYTLAEALALTEVAPTHGYRACGDWAVVQAGTTPDQRRSSAWWVIFEDTTGDPVLYLEIKQGRIGVVCRSQADLALLLTSVEMREEIRKVTVIV